MNQQYTPKISVLVAIYNVGKYLNECLDSLKNQTLKEAEFILVDDYSTDNSLEICNKYAESDSRFKVVRHMENKGLLLVRKTGILNAQGKFCIFLDGDDFLYTKDALDFLVKQMEREKCDLFYFERVTFQDDDSTSNRKYKKDTHNESRRALSSIELLRATYSSNRTLPWLITNKCIRTNVVKQLPSFIPERYLICCEDAFLTFMLGALISNSIISHDEPIYAYRIGTGITTTKPNLSNTIQHSRQFIIIQLLRDFAHKNNLSNEIFSLIDNLKDTIFYFYVNRLSQIDDIDIRLQCVNLLSTSDQLEIIKFLTTQIRTKHDIRKIRRYDRLSKLIPWLKVS